MAMDRGYLCPACGQPTTVVRRTTAFATHISRERECMTCGNVHETMEMRVDIAAVLSHAYDITVETEQAEGARSRRS